MTTQNLANVTTSDTAYDLRQASADLMIDAFDSNPYIKALLPSVKIENKLSTAAGSTVNLYSRLRVDSQGVQGDRDYYADATAGNYTDRNVALNLLSYVEKFKVKGSFSQQLTSVPLDKTVMQMGTNWCESMLLAGIFNQLGGNTATSITSPDASSSAFTSSTLTNITLNNSAVAPTAQYKLTGGGTDTTDQTCTSTTYNLKYIDLTNMAEQITQTSVGQPTWSMFKNKPYIATAFIPFSGLFQLFRENQGSGQGLPISQQALQGLSGGKQIEAYNFFDPITRFNIVGVPDHLMPKGVHSSNATEVSNTRRVIIAGENAMDLVFGAGYTDAMGTIPGFNVEVDTQHKKLNNEHIAKFSMMIGGKKTQITGFGGNESTAYDNAVGVITYYTLAS